MSGTTVQDNGTYGVYVTGTATLTDVDISGHGNILSMNHPGLWIEGGIATLVNTNVFDNEEGVVLSDRGVLTMQGSTVSNNPRTGVLIDETSEATIEDSTISDNASFYAGTTALGGGILNEGWLRLYSSLIDNNHNGGILNRGEFADLVVLDSTISNNDGGLAGLYNGPLALAYVNRSLFADNEGDVPGIENRGDMTMLNSTSTGNDSYGIIVVGGDLSMRFVTLARNGEFGLSAHRGGESIRLVRNLLIAENGVEDCNISSATSVLPLPLDGTNVDSDDTCGFPETFSPAELRIGPLADNGGETWTLALDPASEAVDIVDGFCLAEDQRTFGRPVGVTCDAGAYETGASALSLEDPGLVIGTPTPDQPGKVTITTTTPCYYGPGPQYGQFSTLTAGIDTQLIGAGFTGNGNLDWVITHHPTAANTDCWLDADDVTPNIPFSEMRLITVPAYPPQRPGPPRTGQLRRILPAPATITSSSN